MPDAPGWNESLASASEAAIKADQFKGSPKEMQSHTVKYVKDRHHSADSPTFNEPSPLEPGVSTQHMKHGSTVEPEAPYSKEEIGGPLKDAHGRVVEKEVHKEDVVTRERVFPYA